MSENFEMVKIYWNTMIDEMKNKLRRQEESLDGMRTTARALISGSSLILAIVTVLQLASMRPAAEVAWLWWVLVIASMALYLALVGLTMAMLSPVNFYGPLLSTWENFQSYGNLEMNDFYAKVLSGYLTASDHNHAILAKCSRWLRAALAVFGAIILLLMCLSLIPKA